MVSPVIERNKLHSFGPSFNLALACEANFHDGVQNSSAIALLKEENVSR